METEKTSFFRYFSVLEASQCVPPLRGYIDSFIKFFYFLTCYQLYIDLKIVTVNCDERIGHLALLNKFQ